jgi:hypothetical protein
VKDRKRVPSPATIISCIALFVALGGSGYAATRLATTHSDKSQAAPSASYAKARHKPSQKALIAAAVAKYLKAHRSEFIGPRGPVGQAGQPGGVGPKGDTGPAGFGSATATLTGPVSTVSSSPENLGGPSVTVNVGPSGLVAFYAIGELKSVGGGTAEIALIAPSGFSPQITTNSSSYFKLHSEPGSNEGTFIFSTPLSTDFVGPGTKTFSLEYLDSGGGTGFFKEVELLVIPL